MIAIAGALLASVVLVAWLAVLSRPDLMALMTNGLADGLAALPLQPAATATPQLTPTPPPTPVPTATPVPMLPNADTAGDFPTYLGYEGGGYNPSETLISGATAPDLTVFWTQHGSSVISTQPTVANGLIYWGDWAGNEHATTLWGENVWSTNLGRTWPDVLDPCGYTYNPNPGITSTA
ncbi:MAG TPA: hypothetical protein VF818_11495, partial [Ktedonobacterales bacterium]